MNRLVLLGWPVSHSLSPRIDAAAFAALGLQDWSYEALAVRPEEWAERWAGLIEAGIRGGNVTVPHKREVVPTLDRIDSAAALIGAVNTFVVEDGEVAGYNTDVDGVLGPLAERNVALAGRAAVVLGAGGAARAVVAALYRLGVSCLTLKARRVEAADRLLEDLEPLRSLATSTRSEEWTAGLAEESEGLLVVNATSVGLDDREAVPCSLPDRSGSEAAYAFDCVYSTTPTRWLENAERSGWSIIDGREMLLYQAFRAFELWTNRPAPREAMRAAIDSPSA